MKSLYPQEMVVNRDCSLPGKVSPGGSGDGAIISWEGCMIRNAVENPIGNRASHIRDRAYRGLLETWNIYASDQYYPHLSRIRV